MGKHLSVILATIFVALGTNVFGTELRRPISPSQPLIMVHADVWNDADPQKIIDLIPSDLRPYVVLNISVSINHDASTGKWKTSEYGYSIAKSWLRTAAENRIWATVQPSSGGHLADYDTTVDLDTTVTAKMRLSATNEPGDGIAVQNKSGPAGHYPGGTAYRREQLFYFTEIVLSAPPSLTTYSPARWNFAPTAIETDAPLFTEIQPRSRPCKSNT